MGQLRFEDSDELRAQRMTDEEAQAVVALWAEREAERERQSQLPRVSDVAAGLGIPAEEAAALLREVRERRNGPVTPPVYEVEVASRRRRRALSPLVLAAGIVVLALFAVLALMFTVVETPPVTTGVRVMEIAPPRIPPPDMSRIQEEVRRAQREAQEARRRALEETRRGLDEASRALRDQAERLRSETTPPR